MNPKPVASDTPETDAWASEMCDRGVIAWAEAIIFARKLERERNEAIRILRVLKGDIDHLGHWIPEPCRKLVESFLEQHPTTQP